MSTFQDADAVAEVLKYLRTNTTALAILGDPTPSLSGILEGPWPHLMVTEGVNGDLRNMVWSQQQEVTLQLVSDPTGAPGKAALRQQILALASALVNGHTAVTWLPTDVVISDVRPSGPLVFVPMSTGQISYQLGLMVTVRPPLDS